MQASRAGPAILCALTCAALLLACGGGNDGTRATPTATVERTEPTPTVNAAADPRALVEQAVLACREKDAERLRSLVAASVTDSEIAALFARGVDLQLAGQEPRQIDDAHVEVDVVLDVRRESGSERVERTWALERDASGGWRFTNLPDCY